MWVINKITSVTQIKVGNAELNDNLIEKKLINHFIKGSKFLKNGKLKTLVCKANKSQ